MVTFARCRECAVWNDWKLKGQREAKNLLSSDLLFVRSPYVRAAATSVFLLLPKHGGFLGLQEGYESTTQESQGHRFWGKCVSVFLFEATLLWLGSKEGQKGASFLRGKRNTHRLQAKRNPWFKRCPLFGSRSPAFPSLSFGMNRGLSWPFNIQFLHIA